MASGLPVMTVSELLLTLLKDPSALWPAETGPDCVDDLLELARKERVESLLASKLLTVDNASIPEGLRQQLGKSLPQQTAMELLREMEVQSVMEALACHHIDCLLMKGTPLAYTLYQQPCTRSRCDTDLLFPDAATANRAWQILQAAGYQKLAVAGGDLISFQFPCSKRLSGRVAEMLDIHWEINNYEERCFSFAELCAQSIAVAPLGDGARMPCYEHALLLACAHRLVHLVEGDENRFIWLYDIHLLAESFNDMQWQKVFQLAADKAQVFPLLDGLGQARAHFDTRLSERCVQWLSQHRPTADSARDQNETVLQRDLAKFRSASGLVQRLRLLYQYLFPSADYMRQKYSSHYVFLPWLYLKRAIAGCRSRLKAYCLYRKGRG